MTKETLILATSNLGKIAEFNALLNKQYALNYPPIIQLPKVKETGFSYLENALLKARSAAMATNMPTIADDSGIEIAFLNNEPGIYSARYAKNKDQHANMMKVIQKMHGVDLSSRQAIYRCCLVYLRHAKDNHPIVTYGEWQGHILFAPVADSSLCYYPIFQPAGLVGSAAELSLDRICAVNHRGIAVQKLLKEI